MDTSFEQKIKERFSWTFSQWKEAGVEDLKMKRLVNSLKFWYGRLRSAMKKDNVIITLHNSIERACPKLEQVSQSLSILDKRITIQGYAKFRNRRYISITFKDVATRDFVVQNLKYIGDTQIAYLHWIEESRKTKIILDWLSNHTELDIVCDYVSQFLEISSAYKVKETLKNGTEVLSGKVEISGDLRDNISIDAIPHTDVINGLECSINIEGRPFKCYNCQRLGHKAFQCTKAFCKMCKKMIEKIHECLISFDKELGTCLTDANNGLSSYEQNAVKINNSLNGKVDLKLNNIAESNLFWNKKVITGTQKLQTDNKEAFKQWPMDFNCQKENVSLLRTSVNQVKQKDSGVVTNSFVINNNINLVSIEYIVEDLKANDANFILVDTSSSENDEEMNHNHFSIQDKSSWGVESASIGFDVSRSLLKESGNALDLFELNESKRKNTQTIKDLESKLQEEESRNAVCLGAKPKTFHLNSQVSKNKGKKKKKRKQ